MASRIGEDPSRFVRIVEVQRDGAAPEGTAPSEARVGIEPTYTPVQGTLHNHSVTGPIV